MRRRRGLITMGCVALLALPGCAAHRFAIPVGPVSPAPEAATAWAQARASCQSTSTYRASLKLSGDVGRRHIPLLAAATIGIAVNASGQMGLQASSSGQMIFRVAGSSHEATVLLRDEGDHTLAAPAEDIVEALVGVRLGPARLLAVLSGCVATSADVLRAEHLGPLIRVTTSDATVYLANSAGEWRVRGGTFGAWTISYGDRRDGVPMKLRIDGDPASPAPLMLALSVVDVQRNVDLPASAFVVVVPSSAQPMTLAQLRAAGPLGDR